MALNLISFNFAEINASLQVGDVMYYSESAQNIGGQAMHTVANTRRFGSVALVDRISNVVNVIFEVNPGPSIPSSSAFISFVKDNKINTSSLVGYFASVTFKNNDDQSSIGQDTDAFGKKEIELFSIGASVALSSK